MTVEPRTLRVDLGARGYDIHIGGGLLAQAGDLIAPFLARPYTVIVCDQSVARHHLATVKRSLSAAGIEARSILIPPGEASKSFAQLEKLCADLLAAGVERKDNVIALGGGVIGDLAGFAAGILRRGVEFIQIPTTLLSQVDSSVGGKTGINTPHGKNLVGLFHQPRLVLADLDVMDTLPTRELRAGYAEVVKYGLIDMPDFFVWLEQHGPALLSGDRALLAEAVYQSVSAKARVVAEDEREGGRRALLNLGHTFGHALEVEAGFDGRLLHGEAVAVGLGLAYEHSEQLGLCPSGVAKRIRAHLSAVGLPARVRDLSLRFDPKRLMAAMAQDKKVEQGAFTLILAKGLGLSYIAKN